MTHQRYQSTWQDNWNRPAIGYQRHSRVSIPLEREPVGLIARLLRRVGR